MSKLPDGIVAIGEGGQGRVFDFVCENGITLITDYCHLDKDVWADNSIEVNLGDEKERISITSIDALKDTLAKFLLATLEILSQHTPFNPGNPYTYPDFSDLRKDLLIGQLVFDILFDKYLNESESMTLNRYSNYIAGKLYPDDRENYRHTINEKLTRGMATLYAKTESSILQKQIEMLGIDSNKYAQYYIPHMRKNSSNKKPKFIWDLLYYNFVLALPYRQYRRQLTRDSRNYSYKNVIQDLKAYNNFVTKLLHVEFESYEKYFRMSMDYFVLESYKRIDFIFKLMDILSPDELLAIDRKHFLVDRFVPPVLVPYIQNGELHFARKYKYYRPLLMIENNLFEVEEEDGVETYKLNYIYYGSLLKKYQYVRAKAYELFKYHCIFSSDNYIEIKNFLRQCYDMRTYHQSNIFWNLIQGTEWEDMDERAESQIKERIQHFLSINDAFFWKSTD